MDRIKSLSNLATQLRVLKLPEKKRYLERLEEDAEEYRTQKASGKYVSPFSLQSLAYSLFYSLEGTPYTQPEFSSQATLKDVIHRNKFNVLFAGIIAYTKASDEQKASFKRSALKSPSLYTKVKHLIKIRQNGIA